MRIQILNFTLLIFCLYAMICIVLYLPRLRGWFSSFKKQKRIINKNKERIAVVVPARNESKIINNLFKSLNDQTYPKEFFDVYVVVKDKSDPTIGKTKKFGGVAYVCPDQKCKGDALDFAFKKIINNNIDSYKGIVVVDADCLLDKKFLEEMNNSFASNRDVFQAKKNVKNYLSNDKHANSYSSAANGLIWTLIDDMGNRYKSDHNLTQMTIGTGIMLTTDLVKRLGGWPYRDTVTEDMEFMNDCAIRGITSYYNSYCIMYVEEATGLIMTNKRRSRWLKGLIDSSRIYHEQLSNVEGKEKTRNRYYVNALWIIFRLIGSCVLFSLVNIVYMVICYFLDGVNMNIALMYALFGVGVIYVLFFIMTCFCMIVDRKNIKLPLYKKIILLFYHPIFYMGYIPIVGKALITGVSSRWDVIERIEFKGNI